MKYIKMYIKWNKPWSFQSDTTLDFK